MTDQERPASQPRDTRWGFESAASPSATFADDPPAEDGPQPAEQETTERKRRPSAMREIIETIALAALIFFLVRAVILNYRVDGHSMDPSLADNELLFVNRNAYLEFDKWFLVDWLPGVEHDPDPVRPFGGPERGDIVVLNPPNGDNKPYIKRVIGVPGDHIEIRDNGVYIDGTRIDEPYIDGELTYCGREGRACEAMDIPDGYVYVLGDNRDSSSDSRSFGLVPVDSIIGKAWFTYWPSDYFGPVPHQDYEELGS